MAPAPISHPRPVRWGLFSILKISTALEKETNYDNWYTSRSSDYRHTDICGVSCAWVLIDSNLENSNRLMVFHHLFFAELTLKRQQTQLSLPVLCKTCLRCRDNTLISHQNCKPSLPRRERSFAIWLAWLASLARNMLGLSCTLFICIPKPLTF